MSDSYKIYASQDWVNEKMPEATGSNQQLVTNSEGKAVWEEKPFGEGMTVDVVPLVTLTELDPDVGAFILPENVDLIADTEYTVSWNGTEYVCITHLVTFPDGTTVVALGDSSSITGETSTGEPFGIGTLPSTLTGKTEDIAFARPIDGSTEVELKITTIGVKTLDNKYLEFMKCIPMRASLFKETMEVMGAESDDAICSTMTPVIINGEEEYIISWNGVKYSCIAYPYVQDGLTCVILGDRSVIMGEGTSTGEPFMIAVVPPEGIEQFRFSMICAVLDGSTEVELEILKDAGEPDKYKVKPEYLDVSWNDLSDKPFGEIDNEGAVLSEITIDINTNDGGYIPPLLKEVIIGASYIVVWNGTEYTCTATERTATLFKGYPELGGDGFPFRISFIPLIEGIGGMVYLTDNSSTLTSVILSIRGVGDYIRKIDKEYLPELTSDVTSVNGLTGEVNITATSIGAVPTSRTINGKALSSNITLTADDVNALPNTTQIPSNLVNGSASGSLRTINSKMEDDTYKLGTNAFAGGYQTTAPENYNYTIGRYNIIPPKYKSSYGTLYSTYLNTTLYTISLVVPTINQETGLWESTNTTEVLGSELKQGDLIFTPGTSVYRELTSLKETSDDSQTFNDKRYSIVKNSTYAFTVGNGLSDSSRSNALTIDWNGNAWFKRSIKIGGTGQDSSNAVEVATKPYVDEKFNQTPVKSVNGRTGAVTLTAANVNAVPITRSINGYLLTNDITLPIPSNIINGNQPGSLRTVNSKAEDDTYELGSGAFAEGNFTIASGIGSHAEGAAAIAFGFASHAEGSRTTASGQYSHSEGFGQQKNIIITGEANTTTYTSSSSFTSADIGKVICFNNIYAKITSIDETNNIITVSQTLSSEAITGVTAKKIEGVAFGNYSHSEGYDTTASGVRSHTEGNFTIASGDNSHAEGQQTIASGDSSHTEGQQTIASGDSSHTEGILSIAAGEGSHAEGYNTKTSGSYSHTEGSSTIASGDSSHAEGNGAKASGNYSHAEGLWTIASGDYSHVQGKYNIEDENKDYVHIVGNGSSTARSNAHTIDWSGVGWFAGGLKVGGTGQDDEAAKDVVLAPEAATVGQMIVVKEIDENGKPTAWEAVDVPEGDGVFYVTMTQGELNKYSSDKTFAEVAEAYSQGQLIVCKAMVGSSGTTPKEAYFPLTEARIGANDYDRGFRFEGFVDEQGSYNAWSSNYMSFKLRDNDTLYSDYEKIIHEDDIPNSLPNPKNLVIKKDGTYHAFYDGSEQVEINISSGASEVIMAEYDYGNISAEAYPDNQIPIFDLVEYPTSGKNYIVNWNGVEYYCIAKETVYNGLTVVALGNFAVVGGPNTGEPFAIGLAPDGTLSQAMGVNGLIMPIGEITSLIVSIKEDTVPISARPAVFYMDNMVLNETNYLYRSAESAANQTESDRITYAELSEVTKANRQIIIRYIHNGTMPSGETLFYPVTVSIVDEGKWMIIVYDYLIEKYMTFYNAEYTET